MEDYLFCTACGKQLGPGETYCPACGTAVASAPSQSAYGGGDTLITARRKVRTAGILLALGAVSSLIMGVYFIAATDSLVDMMVDVYGTADLENMMGMTVDQIGDALRMSGYMMAACGALCAVSAVLCFTYRLWPLALLAAIAAAVLGAQVIIGLILGAIACWYIYKYREAFQPLA